MLVNSTPKLTQYEWVNEQHEDLDIGAAFNCSKTIIEKICG